MAPMSNPPLILFYEGDFFSGTSFFYILILIINIYLFLIFHTSALDSFLQFMWLNIDVRKFLEHFLSTLKIYKS